MGEDHGEENADCGEGDTDEAAGELQLGPDCYGDIVPGGVDRDFEVEEGVQAKDCGYATAVLHQCCVGERRKEEWHTRFQ